MRVKITWAAFTVVAVEEVIHRMMAGTVVI